MKKIIAISIASIILFASCVTTDNSGKNISKEDRLEQNDIYIPWWVQEDK